MKSLRYSWLGVSAPSPQLAGFAALAMMAVIAMMAGSAHAEDEGVVTLAPRVAIEAGYDSNYALEATGAVPAGQTTGIAGLGIDWAPTIRTRYGIRADYRETRFFTSDSARDLARSLSTAVQVTHLFSLRTNGWLRAGAMLHRSPIELGDVTSAIGSFEGGIGWRPVRSWRYRFEGGYWDIRDQAGGSPGSDGLGLARLGAAWDRAGLGGFSSTLEGTRFLSPRGASRYTSAGGSLLLWVGLWNGGVVALEGNVERRWYDAVSGAKRRLDLQWTGGGGLVQSVGASQRLRLGVWREQNHSPAQPFLRNTAKLVWECDPVWSF